MQLVRSYSKADRRTAHKWPTVGEMLDYIEANDIPMDAEIVVEHISDYYLTPEGGWSHYIVGTKDSMDGCQTMLPVHNGFGSIEQKKFIF